MPHASLTANPVTIQIGGIALALHNDSPEFLSMLATRYDGFVVPGAQADFDFEIQLTEPAGRSVEDDVNVSRMDDCWQLTRGDFHAEWNTKTARGMVKQSNNPYAIDSVLRIVHTLILASRGGFLVHAASAIRHGHAFLFAGISGAGKTTISRLAPADTTLLSDEISYVRNHSGSYVGCGTPFAGELARVGENRSAPIKTLFFLEKGPTNRIEPVEIAKAVQLLLRNVLFFANDPELVKMLFASACEFVQKVPVRRLFFVPDARVWEIIG
jgi:hypothetical protein